MDVLRAIQESLSLALRRQKQHLRIFLEFLLWFFRLDGFEMVKLCLLINQLHWSVFFKSCAQITIHVTEQGEFRLGCNPGPTSLF